MTWRHITLTIATIVAVALPSWVKGEHCRENSWNQALEKQQQLDDWYNKHASSFNQMLYLHRQKNFLHQQFSITELKQFWLPQNGSLQLKVSQQIYNANMVVSQLQEEETHLRASLPNVQEMQKQWEQISSHCDEAKLVRNAITSTHYALSNYKLEKDLTTLINKVGYLKSLYQQEADLLQEILTEQ
ncbi:hypothetical protein [Vibrio marisflavi]|uniref:ATPase n=1 Tax=Vibrio marisflavi CECT 7928 TaxID=634439 RepID=A0ABM9A0R6_9VIBR|nr:hypothetical protein [Vibrio marisflavi]CAH0536999.1 hypothetical protein VMF7928_00856 [Vibrio marisflavi CECT 7928]